MIISRQGWDEKLKTNQKFEYILNGILAQTGPPQSITLGFEEVIGPHTHTHTHTHTLTLNLTMAAKMSEADIYTYRMNTDFT